MSEQCLLLKTVASNQQELAKLMKVSGVPEPSAPPPLSCIGSYGTPSTPAPPAFMGFGSHSHAPPQLPPVVGRFWNNQPVVAPNLEPNESRNPPSAAYASQETPGRQPRPIEVLNFLAGSSSVPGPSLRKFVVSPSQAMQSRTFPTVRASDTSSSEPVASATWVRWSPNWCSSEHKSSLGRSASACPQDRVNPSQDSAP